MLTVLLATTLAASAAAQDVPAPPPAGGAMMMRADGNGDGIITRDEHLTQAAERFDRLDANRDGKLTADEMARVSQRMRGMRDRATAPASAQ